MKKKFLPPIKKSQVAADTESPKIKVNFNLEATDVVSNDTKRPLLTHIDMEKVKSEDDLKGPSPIKKILVNTKDGKSMSPTIKEVITELDFDDGLFILQKTFNLKTLEILKNLKVFFNNILISQKKS